MAIAHLLWAIASKITYTDFVLNHLDLDDSSILEGIRGNGGKFSLRKV